MVELATDDISYYLSSGMIEYYKGIYDMSVWQ